MMMLVSCSRRFFVFLVLVYNIGTCSESASLGDACDEADHCAHANHRCSSISQTCVECYDFCRSRHDCMYWSSWCADCDTRKQGTPRGGACASNEDCLTAYCRTSNGLCSESASLRDACDEADHCALSEHMCSSFSQTCVKCDIFCMSRSDCTSWLLCADCGMRNQRTTATFATRSTTPTLQPKAVTPTSTPVTITITSTPVTVTITVIPVTVTIRSTSTFAAPTKVNTTSNYMLAVVAKCDSFVACNGATQ